MTFISKDGISKDGISKEATQHRHGETAHPISR
jgi:hypothetical protein